MSIAPATISGAELRRKRHSLGLTLEALANGICSVAYLSLIEQGQREASERMAAMLLARLSAAETESGIAVQLTALRIAENEFRNQGSVAPSTANSPALKNHAMAIEVFELESRGEFDTAIAQLDVWLSEHQKSRDLQSFGARIKIRLLRAAGRDTEALQFGARILAAATAAIKSRQDDLLEVAFQVSSLYSAAGAWRDAVRVLDSQRERLTEPRQLANSHWAKSDALFAKGDVDSALLEARAALSALEALDLPAAAAELSNNCIWFELLAGHVDEKRQRAELAASEAILRNAGNSAAVASVLNTLALLEARLGNRDEVKRVTQAAIATSLNTASRTHDELLLAVAEIGLACDLPELATSSLAAFDANTRTIAPSRAEANLLFRAGQIVKRMGDTQRANDYLSRSLEMIGFTSVAP